MKRLGTCLIFTVCFLQATAQTSEIFFDYQWRQSAPDRARFFAHVKQTDSGWVRQDYYLPKKNLQMKGLYRDADQKIKHGHFYFFYPSGQLSSTGLYENNEKQGMWLSFHPNGYMSDSTFYESGKPTGTSMRWHQNGYISDSISYTNYGAVQVSWFDNGNLSSAGRVDLQEKPIGKWQFFHQNGNLSAEEVYEAGNPVSKKFFNEDGTAVRDTARPTQGAHFRGGVEGWLKYLDSHLYWPSNYELVNGDMAAIGVKFTVDETGTVKNVLITVPFDDAFNDIVLRIIKNSPKWEPAISHNRKVSYDFTQTVQFKQERR